MNLVFVTVPGLAMRSIEAVFVGGKLAKGLPPCHRMIPTDWVGHHHIAGRERKQLVTPCVTEVTHGCLLPTQVNSGALTLRTRVTGN